MVTRICSQLLDAITSILGDLGLWNLSRLGRPWTNEQALLMVIALFLIKIWRKGWLKEGDQLSVEDSEKLKYLPLIFTLLAMTNLGIGWRLGWSAGMSIQIGASLKYHLCKYLVQCAPSLPPLFFFLPMDNLHPAWLGSKNLRGSS
jgi:hypothetical protein